MKIIAFLFTAFISLQMSGQEKFPDGTPIPDWFRQNEIVNIDTLGKKYTITDYGVANDSTILQTEKIQAVIGQPRMAAALSSSPKERSSAAPSSSSRKRIYTWKKVQC